MIRQKRILDLLVVIQVACAVFHAFGQWSKLATAESIQGVSLTWFGCWELFLILNLILAWRAHHHQASRETVQVIINYFAWLVAISGDLVIITSRGIGQWTVTDIWTAAIASVAIVVVLLISRDSAPRLGGLAISFRVVPQLVLAYFYSASATTALSGIALIAGHVAIGGRIANLGGSLIKEHHDRNRLWPIAAEMANWLTWALLTLVWVSF